MSLRIIHGFILPRLIFSVRGFIILVMRIYERFFNRTYTYKKHSLGAAFEESSRMCRRGRHPGAALLAIVLVGFLVLSVLSLAAFDAATQSTRIEIFQTEHFQKLRLQYFARSCAIAVSGQMSAYYAANNERKRMAMAKSGTTTLPALDPGGTVKLTYKISGDPESTYITIETTAQDSDTPKALKMKCSYSKYAASTADSLYAWEMAWVDK